MSRIKGPSVSVMDMLGFLFLEEIDYIIEINIFVIFSIVHV